MSIPRFFSPFVSLVSAALLATHAGAAPLHVLYLGEVRPLTKTAPAEYSFLPGQKLAPEAIYFDYQRDPAKLTPAYLSHFDAVLAAPDFAPPPTLSLGARSMKTLTGEILADTAKLRAFVLEAVSPAARQEWDTFVKGRAPLQYEPRPEIANYEKRPQPLPYQLPLPAAESMKYTQVPADCELRLFASEPDIFKPIAMAWDERGRLWIAETRDYPNEVRPAGEGNDDIKICEDTNGDGRADKFTIFADKLNIPTSLTFSNGGLIVAQAPSFLFLKDTNGDGKADVRQELFAGLWGKSDTHAGPSNLHWGFDNWVYGTVGYAGFRGTPDRRTRDFKQGMFRFRQDGSALEFLHQFTNNTWGFGYNDAGDLFASTANAAPSFFCGIPQTVVPAGQRTATARIINDFDRVHPNTSDIRQVDVMGGYTAAAGHMFMNSGALPERLRGQALVCEPTAKLISIFNVQPKGAGYVSRDGLNLLASADEWMSPVAAEVGPDGAVWVADWYNFIIQHNPTPTVQKGGYESKTGKGNAHESTARDTAHGRIYRVVWKDGAAPALKSLAGASTPQLLGALGSDNQFWRLTAQRLLVEGGRKDAVAALKTMVLANTGKVDAIHALWSLQGLGALDPQSQEASLKARDSALRRNGVRALPADEAAAKLLLSTPVLQDADLTTRLAALVKLAQFPTSKEIQTAVGKLGEDPVNGKEEWLSEAVKLLAKVHKVRNYTEGPNLLAEGGFETPGAADLPQGWTLSKAEGDKIVHTLAVAPDVHGGTRSVRFEAPRPGMEVVLAAETPVQPGRDYRLTGWIKTNLSTGAAYLGVAELKVVSERFTRETNGWQEVEVVFQSGDRQSVTLQCILHGPSAGTASFDDLALTELTYAQEKKVVAGDVARGEQIFLTSPVAACTVCHMVGGKGGVVGPALDGIASKKDEAYLLQSLIEPSATIAEGFTFPGNLSPMPPMGAILKEQEVADVQAYLLTLKNK